MNGFITVNRFARCFNVPIYAAQTELRAGKTLRLARVTLNMNQRLELRALSLSLLAVLNPEVTPIYLNSALGMCSVGLYNSTIISSPLAYTTSVGNTTAINPFSPCIIETPGTYDVILSNNTSNADLSVSATGALKFYY